MADALVWITDSDSDGERAAAAAGRPRSRCRLRRGKRKKRRRKGDEEIVDLTEDDLDMGTSACNDFGIIDLTESEETVVSSLRDGCVALDRKHSTPTSTQPLCPPNLLAIPVPENELDVSVSLWNTKCEQPLIKEEALMQTYWQDSSSVSSCAEDSENSSSATTYNSDMGSLGSPQLDSDVFSFSSSASNSSEHKIFLDCVEEIPRSVPPEDNPNPQRSPPCQRHLPSPLSCHFPVSIPTSLAEADRPWLQASHSAPSAIKGDLEESTKQADIKVWMKTLQYFPGVPAHHPFLQNLVQAKDATQNKQMKTQPIPRRRLDMVYSTIEENFFKGTLDFLTDFVSYQYYPPKAVTSCVIREILLISGQQDVRKDAYMLLMKIQALHPAKADTVVWDWKLLFDVMENKEEKFLGQLLFLQYVIQTLEDDFQRMARRDFLHKSIAKAVLSYDQCSSNIKDVIEWLVAATTGRRCSQHMRSLQTASRPLAETARTTSISLPELPLRKTAQTDDTSSSFQSQKEMALLQRMLFIAVEVDKSPNCSARKIAELVLPSVLDIPKRSQRQAFLSTMECHLLRCNVLELISAYNCKVPTANLPLSVTKILHFINHLSLRLKYQDEEAIWQRWDEMLHHLTLLLLSYHAVVLGHLRSPVCERIKLIIKAVKPTLQSDDCISSSDAKDSITCLQEQLLPILGQPLPSPIKKKIDLLKVLLLSTTMDNTEHPKDEQL